jgi:hypothetical protein
MIDTEDTLTKSIKSKVDCYRLHNIIRKTNNINFNHIILFDDRLFSNSSRKSLKKQISTKTFSIQVWVNLVKKFLKEPITINENDIFDEFITVLSITYIYDLDSIGGIIYDINDQLVILFEKYPTLVTYDNFKKILSNGIPIEIRVINMFLDIPSIQLTNELMRCYIENIKISILNIFTFEHMFKKFNTSNQQNDTFICYIISQLFEKIDVKKHVVCDIVGTINTVIDFIVNETKLNMTKKIFKSYTTNINLNLDVYKHNTYNPSFHIMYSTAIIYRSYFEFTIDDLKNLLSLDTNINVDDVIKCLLSKSEIIVDNECIDICCSKKRIILIPILIQKGLKITEEQLVSLFQYGNEETDDNINLKSNNYLYYNKLYLINCINSYVNSGGTITSNIFRKCVKSTELFEEIIKLNYKMSLDDMVYAVNHINDHTIIENIILGNNLLQNSEFINSMYEIKKIEAIEILIENKIYPNIEQLYILLQLTSDHNLICNVKKNGNLMYDNTCLFFACSRHQNSKIILNILDEGIEFDKNSIEALFQTDGNTEIIKKLVKKGYIFTLQNLKDINKHDLNITRKIISDIIENTY